MSKYLSFYGGDRAISIIKERGLTQDIVKVVAGAAGGPKWLILGAMDRFLFSEWFTKRGTLKQPSNSSTFSESKPLINPDPLFLIGSSAGAWRFSAASHNDPVKALEKFFDSYIHQWYSIKPTLDEIDVECQKVLDKFLDENSVNEILNHPYCRINFFSVRSKLDFTNQNPISSKQNSISTNKNSILDSINDNPIVLVSYITAAAIANIFNRRNMSHFFTRTLFHHPSEKPPFYDMDKVNGKDNFPMLKVPLTSENFKKALLSSGSIPLVMPCIKDIPQAPKGVYRDGGTIDYHLDIPFLPETSSETLSHKIVLFPHYTDRIVPGWLDKHIAWRKPDPDNFRDVLLITPTKKFTDMLPGGKIPERQDFQTFKGKNRERIERWKIALKYSEILGDELCRIFYSGNMINIIEPIEKII
ncbi:MAG: hypothetical protein HQK72_10380 [Desulfamplus sp.]|nr:hypothetical protein [Desulfamplus sp.]